jgi:hypothetical protein
MVAAYTHRIFLHAACHALSAYPSTALLLQPFDIDDHEQLELAPAQGQTFTCGYLFCKAMAARYLNEAL